MSFLNLTGRTILVFGVANKRSVAYHVGTTLEQEGARVIYSVRSQERVESLGRLLADREVHVCDVEREAELSALAERLRGKGTRLHGIVHSLAFANYEHFSGAFHEVSRADFLQAAAVSCHSLIGIANAMKDLLDPRASVVAISISTTAMAAESYGYMAPVKAALDSSIVFLAKSFSRFSEVRFNAVGAGLLKTSASAGIPGYLDNYIFAEQATLRHRALETQEVADATAYLLSDRSSGINAQRIIVDAGMGVNYFDADIIRAVSQSVYPTEPA